MAPTRANKTIVAGLFALAVLVGGVWVLSRGESSVVAPVEAPSPTPEEVAEDEVILGATGTRVVSELYISDTTWDAPTGVTSVFVEAIGGGAGGTTNTGGGGGGAYAAADTPVTPGNTYTIDVGAGGAAAASGSDSVFHFAGTVKIRADAGLDAAAGGNGGTTAISSGSTEYAGGNATPAAGTRGGGSAAGNAGAGVNATTAGVDGGINVFGGGSPSGTAAPKQFGNGGGSSAGGAGAGANGMVRLTYTVADTGTFPKLIRVEPSVNSVANSTTMTVTAPASSYIQAGDVHVIIFSHGLNTDSNITTGSGWTERASSSNTTTISSFVFTKTATTSSEPNVVITSAGSQQHSAVWYVIRDGVFDSATSANGASTNANPPSQAFAGGSANYLILAAAGLDGNTAGASVTAKPSTYESFYNSGYRATGTNSVVTVAALKQVTGTSENPGTFTSVNEEWVAHTVAIKYQDGSPAGASSVDPIIWFD